MSFEFRGLNMYKSYGLLRPVVVFAGTIGIIQSLLWLALSVIAILAYYCVFNFRGVIASLGTITELTLFHMYFHGPCPQSGMPNIDFADINKLNLAKPVQVHICMWIYLALSILWLISSITLLTNVRYVNLKNANYFLHIWIFVAVAQSMLDLGLGITFAIDYDTLRHEAHNIAIDDQGAPPQPQYLVVSAKAAAGIMMSAAFRGYTVWLINIVLCIYFFTQTFKISDYNRIKEAISNPSFVPSGTLQKKIAQQRSPYGDKYDRWIESLQNYTYQPNGMDQPTPTDTHRQNQAAALFEERKRHYEAQQLNYLRYIDKRNGRKMRSNSFGNGQVSSGQSPIKKHREINVPLPDYSPNMHRNDSFETRPPLRSALRSSRY